MDILTLGVDPSEWDKEFLLGGHAFVGASPSLWSAKSPALSSFPQASGIPVHLPRPPSLCPISPSRICFPRRSLQPLAAAGASFLPLPPLSLRLGVSLSDLSRCLGALTPLPQPTRPRTPSSYHSGFRTECSHLSCRPLHLRTPSSTVFHPVPSLFTSLVGMPSRFFT